MLKVLAMIQTYKKDVKGATAIEYGLIAGGISLAIVAAVFAFGDSLRAFFEAIAGKMGEVSGNVQ